MLNAKRIRSWANIHNNVQYTYRHNTRESKQSRKRDKYVINVVFIHSPEMYMSLRKSIIHVPKAACCRVLQKFEDLRAARKKGSKV